jgi:Family of unknown function (DUF6011)
MTNTLAHSFDCDCETCTGSDTAQGMAIFRKPARSLVRNIEPVTVKTEPVRRLPAGQKVGNGRVRSISDRQEWFILKLIKERDLTNLHLVTGQTLDPTEIPYMGLKGAKALIEKMLGCPYKGTDSPVMAKPADFTPASEAQVNYYVSLMGQKMKRGFTKDDITTPLSKKDAMRLIGQLKDMPYLPRETVTPVKSTEVTELSEGMYKCGAKIFKVYFNQAGTRLLAKELIDGSFEYQGMASRFVKPENRMTLEEAKAYGKVTGTCCVCSRRLTDEESIAEGIGPVCAKKF